MWLYILVFVQFILFISFLGFFLKKLYSIKSSNIIVKNDNIENSVKEGVKGALKELEREKNEEEELMKFLDREKRGIGVFSSINKEEEIIRTGGDLIPANLTDSEKELLRMFYNQ